MAIYRYIATESASGAQRRGELAADSAYQVRAALRRMALQPVRVTELELTERRPEHSSGTTGASGLLGRLGTPLRAQLASTARRLVRNRRRSQLVEFCENFATLAATGTTVTEALDVIAGQATGAVRNSNRGSHVADTGTLARVLAHRVRGGASLADAMSDPPGTDWFSDIDRALVRVAQESGELERTLSDLAEHHGRSERLRGRIAGVLAYPALLLVFGLGVVVFLTTTTLPPLAAVLSDAGVELPWPTKVLLAVGALVTRWWPVAIAAAIAIAAGVVWAARSIRLARARLRIPLLGTVLMRGQLGEACLLIARLLNGGVPLTAALSLVSPSVPNAVLRSGLDDFRRTLEQGRDVAGAMADPSSSPGVRRPARAGGRSQRPVFEPVFRRVLQVGQESGEMAAALSNIGRRYRESALRLSDRLAAALEPAVVLLLAAMVGFVVYAAITPMLKLSQTIH